MTEGSGGVNRLLIVDDEVEVGRYVSQVARACGYTVEAVLRADAFRDRLDTWQPSHVVLDLQIDDADGIELLRHMAERKSTARILVMSGFDQRVLESVRHLGIERGLDIAAILQKPIRAAQLRTLFEQLKISEAIDAQAVAAAIERNELVLHYQPKIALNDPDDTHPICFEALVRWRHPQRGLVPPGEFIPIAEEEGLIDALSDAVIGLALAQLSAWNQKGLGVLMAVNVSAANLRQADFTDRLTARCREAGVAPGQLVIELTETAAMRDAAQAMDSLTRLRIRGFRLAIDDFGTGYSSLVQLQRLPFSELKIDRAFVADCHVSGQSRTIVNAMINLAHNLGLTCVAEGVENAEILEVLRELNCDLAQGYHIGRPMPAEQAEAWLREWQGP